MNQLLIFASLSVPVIYISRKSLIRPQSHGFYRFFGWEGTLWMVIANIKYWFTDPFGALQICSWLLLLVSVYYVTAGTLLLIRSGKPHEQRTGEALYEFEKTTELVETGLYQYVRHPLYGSLIFLTWGVLLKHPTTQLIVVASVTTLFYFLTARKDELECIAYFGEKYSAYMKRSKMFIPFVV